MSEAPWPAEWLRGVLEPCVLRVLADGPTYGYAIAERLDALGLGRLKGGTLYPLLGRMETAGHVTTEWRAGDGGPGRKYYELTPPGRDALRTTRTRWQEFTETTLAALGDGVPAPDASHTPDAPETAAAPESADAPETPDAPESADAQEAPHTSDPTEALS